MQRDRGNVGRKAQEPELEVTTPIMRSFLGLEFTNSQAIFPKDGMWSTHLTQKLRSHPRPDEAKAGLPDEFVWQLMIVVVLFFLMWCFGKIYGIYDDPY